MSEDHEDQDEYHQEDDEDHQMMETDEADMPSEQIEAEKEFRHQTSGGGGGGGRIVKGGGVVHDHHSASANGVDHHEEEMQASHAAPELDPHHPSMSSSTQPQRRRSSYTPSDHLVKPTTANEMDRVTWDQKQKEKETTHSPVPVKKQDPNYVLPEGLTKLTQSRLAERREWEEHVKNREYEDDIWWEKRKPTPRAQKIDVPSKLKEPTIAVLNCKRSKHPLKSDDRQGSQSPSREHSTSHAKIDVNSPLLKTTAATKYGQVDKNGNLKNPPEAPVSKGLDIVTKGTGPQVGSKLWRETKSYEYGKWSKPEEAKAPSPPKAVRPPSARLLEFNTAMNAQKRDKVVKPEGDEREKGWDTWHIKQQIPPLESEDGAVTGTPSRTNKRGSTSPRLTSPRASTSPRTSINSTRSSQAVPENIFSKLTEAAESSNQDDAVTMEESQ